MRSTPVNSHRRNASNATSLPAIDEDNASFLSNSTKPPVPPRALNRPQGHGRYLGPGFGSGSAQGWIDSDGSEGPPSYNTSDDGRNEKDRFAELRRGFEENKHISKRGGWRRLLLLFLILLVIGVALGVGLGVGLKKKNSWVSSLLLSKSTLMCFKGMQPIPRPQVHHQYPPRAALQEMHKPLHQLTIHHQTQPFQKDPIPSTPISPQSLQTARPTLQRGCAIPTKPTLNHGIPPPQFLTGSFVLQPLLPKTTPFPQPQIPFP